MFDGKILVFMRIKLRKERKRLLFESSIHILFWLFIFTDLFRMYFNGLDLFAAEGAGRVGNEVQSVIYGLIHGIAIAPKIPCMPIAKLA